MNENQLKLMKFNEIIELHPTQLHIRRVIGGWIYEYYNHIQKSPISIKIELVTCVFVPEIK